MKFQTLISTMNGKIFHRKVDIPFESLIINQYEMTEAKQSGSNIFQFKEKGLAKSRNHALNHAEADICHISDDDLEYLEDMKANILQAFIQYPEADIITFQIKTPDGLPYKKYKNKTFWHTKKTLMKVSSVEIVYRRESIKRVNLSFDIHFGLGSIFPTGEEIIFLTDALVKGLKILYIPTPIVVHPIESSGKNYDNIALIKAKGAMFYRIFGFSGYIIAMLFAYKKYNFSPFSFRKFTKLMFNGIQKYRSYS